MVVYGKDLKLFVDGEPAKYIERNKKLNINLLIENLKTVGIKFSGSSKTYTYKTFEDFEVGDKAIVDSPFEGFAVVTIVRVDDVPDIFKSHNYKWIVQRINTEDYDYRISAEYEFKRALEIETYQTKMKEEKRKLKKMLNVKDKKINSIIQTFNNDLQGE